MKRFKLTLMTLVAAILPALPTMAEPGRDMVFFSGRSGGLWYPIGAIAKAVIEDNIPGSAVTLKPDDGISNIVAVATEKADLAWTFVLTSNEAITGTGAFEERGVQSNICNMAVLYPNIIHLMAADPGIQSVEDMKGHSIGALSRGSTTEYAIRTLLDASDLTYEDFSKVNFAAYSDQANMIKDGQIDVMSGVTGVGTGAFLDVATARDVHLLPISDELLADLKAVNPGWQRMVIPAGSYSGQTEDVQSAGFAMQLVSHCNNVSEELGYEITKALTENIKDFGTVKKELIDYTPADIGIDTGIPDHPGALRYFKEIGAR